LCHTDYLALIDLPNHPIEAPVIPTGIKRHANGSVGKINQLRAGLATIFFGPGLKRQNARWISLRVFAVAVWHQIAVRRQARQRKASTIKTPESINVPVMAVKSCASSRSKVVSLRMPSTSTKPPTREQIIWQMCATDLSATTVRLNICVIMVEILVGWLPLNYI
jgi:hypothetical protein